MRTITNPANNSTLSSSVIRNELQTLETEVADTTNGHDHDGTDSKRVSETNLNFDTSNGHNHNGTNSRDLTLAKPTKFWAEVSTISTTLTSQGSASLFKNPDYTVTVLQPNSNGFKSRLVWGIVGGFYFTAPRTGYYRLAATTSIRAYGANGPTTVCMRLTLDTSSPAYNNDTTDDGGSELLGTTVLGATDSVDYNDTVCLATQKVVSLAANTTYYFTLQIKHMTSASTINIMTFADTTFSGATLFIEEMRL